MENANSASLSPRVIEAAAMRCLLALLISLSLLSAPASSREVVQASEPQDLSVTIYRDPERGEGDAMDRGWSRGFAMISEVRTVNLPAGQSTIRFEGVAEGMVSVSAIVTGLPGGTIEKNRNADLLSPAALLDGTLGNRVRITRTNPATGVAKSEEAIVRTRADGGLVLQTSEGYEAVRCSGLPESLSFERVPIGLSAQPVFSIDTRDEGGGTYQVTLTYLAWGFDWEAHYVATLDERGAKGEVGMRLLSWLTLLNDNGQSFPNAELLAVAGTINVTSDFEQLSNPPTARPLRLTCYPLGSTAAGTPIPPPLYYPVLSPPPSPMAMMEDGMIMVTASRRQEKMQSAPVAMMAREEQLGDLKLYRIPERVNVAAKGLKQVAFLNKEAVRGEFIYEASCNPYGQMQDELVGAGITFETVNDKKHGLGAALPMGGLSIFEPSSHGDLLIADKSLRDYAVLQDVEIELGQSSMVFSECSQVSYIAPEKELGRWLEMRTKISNANRHRVMVRVEIGTSSEWDIRSRGNKPRLKDGVMVIEYTIPAGKAREFNWQIRRPASYFADDEI